MKTHRESNKKVPEAITAQQIIDDLIIRDDPANLQEDLQKMFHHYIVHNDDMDQRERQEIYTSFLILSDALGEMEKLNPRKANVDN
jgi:ribosome recycling factor